MNPPKGPRSGSDEAGAPSGGAGSRPTPSRRARYVVGQLLPVVGVGGTMLVTDILRRVLVVAVGVLMVEVAVWNVANHILPDSRSYLPLRNEIDRFIQLARRLNAAAVSLAQGETVPARRTFDTVRDDMVEAVHRIANMAGKTANEPDDEPAVVHLAPPEAVPFEDARPQDPERPPRP